MDLIEIDRIARALERPRFRERVYTEAERAYCDSKANPAQSYAARFAGKEAVGKALGCGVDFSWREIEIVGRPKPTVKLTGRTLAFAEKRGLTVADLSMTHSKGVAGAVAIVQRDARVIARAGLRVVDLAQPLSPDDRGLARHGSAQRADVGDVRRATARSCATWPSASTRARTSTPRRTSPRAA